MEAHGHRRNRAKVLVAESRARPTVSNELGTSVLRLCWVGLRNNWRKEVEKQNFVQSRL